ncbi:MAG: TldD/PmbA family protein, partial [Acidimicrobiales bacterium]
MTTAAAAAATALAPPLLVGRDPQADASVRDLCNRAMNAAKRAGAGYADVRVVRNRNQSVSTREQQITGLQDAETFGFGVRVLVAGAWGFAASRDLTANEVERIARLAVAQAKANRRAVRRPVTLAPTPPVPDGRWQSPIEIDPFTVPIEDKVALLLKANAEALKVSGARFVNSSMFFVLQEKTFASTDDIFTVQKVYRCLPQLSVTAVDPAAGFQTRQSNEVAGAGRGYEWVVQADLPGKAGRWAEEAVQKLTAKSVEPGRYDLILEPHHLWLTIHESIAHPTELDRALGYEANFAGTSFATPDKLGNFAYAAKHVTLYADKTTPGGLASCGYDDDGVATQRW